MVDAMQEAVTIFIHLLKNAWAVIVSFILVAAACGGLYRILSTIGASLLGMNHLAAELIGAVATILMLALLAFLGVPALIRGSIEAVNGNPGLVCADQADSPLIELTTILVQLLIAMGAIRLMVAFARAIVSAAVGLSGQMARAFMEAGGVLMVSFLASVVVPVAATFLGACHRIPMPDLTGASTGTFPIRF